MKRILINATHNEEIRVALCKDNHLYDFDLENRTREQKKANIYKGHVTRVEPSLEAVFVEYGSARQGFLPLREIAPEYLKGNPRNDNIRDLIKEGDEVIIQIEKEERGNKGAAVSTYISLAGRYLVLMPNNHKAGGISRQISGKVREEMKQIINSLSIPQGMSVIVRTAGIGKGFEDLQNDLNHLLDIWSSILEQNRTRPSPCLVHQEAGVVTRAVRDYLRDDIGEVWIDSENAYNEAANFIASVMPNQMSKLRKYIDHEPLFVRFGIERQIESAYQREVRLPSGGSIVIDQTEAMVAIDINSAKSTKGSDVAETAYHTNLEAAEEIARQLRLRDMGGLIVIDFIDMNDPAHQKEVEKRLIDATRYDRARVQFAEISKFGLMEMSRQRLRPSLEEATGYLCPRCHGNGMIRDLRSLALSIMRQIEQIALKERYGEIQAEVPTEIAAFLLNEKRESLVYLEQDSGVRVTILPHAHLESPNFSLHFNPDGFAPASYERIMDVEERENVERGYEVNWQTKHDEPTTTTNRWQQADSHSKSHAEKPTDKTKSKKVEEAPTQPQAVAWLSNLFAPKPQARLAHDFGSHDAASAIEALVNGGATSLGSFGNIHLPESKTEKPTPKVSEKTERPARTERDDKAKRKPKKEVVENNKQDKTAKRDEVVAEKEKSENRKKEQSHPKREANSQREPRGEIVRGETLKPKAANKPEPKTQEKPSNPKEQVCTEKVADTKPQKHTNPNDVVIHINPSASADATTTKTVHISLDGSKEADRAETPTTEGTIETTSNRTPKKEDATLPTPTHHEDKISPATDTSKADDHHTLAIHDAVQDDFTPSAEHLMALSCKTGRAINDPRVVADVMREQMSLSAPATTIPHATITGTAGQFVEAVLSGELSDDWRENFVTHFIAAVNRFALQNTQHQNSLTTPMLSESDFEREFAKQFANYGYAPLSGEYLTTFTKGISADGAWHTKQGKTHATPHPVVERAINDPRGQPSKQAESINQVNTDEKMPSQERTTVSNEPPLMPTSSESESVLELLIKTLDEIINSANSQEGDTQKSTPASYKDMIENVSGQLLQPTGILNLVASKKPKATKPKTPKTPKAPTKRTSKAAQKAEVVKRPKAETSTPPNEADLPQS
ncbi:MAG: Rne/Rng family ribonuclease [Moraxella sp.]|uniref:Rne/Rng family ribonuclease n=1 Tax=Moraxella sp. TaxID=479 RepID=UPI0026DC895E|nr:Rne/Rng family ribonuclease [Moraxella sp.]MDO4449608.1 Rne/Rng family ribonuclease [Moraxella sp.]